MATLQILIHQHLENLVFQVTKLGSTPLILGKTWLRRHNPLIDWADNTVTFRSPWCQLHCLPQRSAVPSTRAKTPSSHHSPGINMISAAAFAVAVRQPQTQVFAVAIRDLVEEGDESQLKSKAEDLDALRKIIPPEYHDFLPTFTKAEADKLPRHRYIDHAIDLEDGAKPCFGPLYSMSASELKEVRSWLRDNLSKVWIRSSSSSAASPILFAKKKDGSLRLCVDYRALNAISKKNRYPLPLIEETLHQVSGSKYFTRLDLRSYFNLIRIKEGDEWKTAFRTRYGLFEFLVMPFGLTNAPATGQQFINDTLREYLDVFCSAYIDDILIYSETKEDHTRHVRAVLQKLAEAGLFASPGKCEFSVSQTSFLGFIVGADGISMDPAKLDAIHKWESPTCVRDVQCFLGFANFYRRFIHRYSYKCRMLYDLLRKGTKFSWTPACEKAFLDLKEAFTTAPILRHFDPSLETILETDASDFVASGVLSQKFPEDDRFVLHPVAYYSRKLTAAECNYGIGDKELLAIVIAFEEWRPHLLGAKDHVLILTDHHNLQGFLQKKLLNRRQARWALDLAEYNFKIHYRPGPQNGKADALTRRSGDLPQEGDGRSRPTDSVLQPENFDFSASNVSISSTSRSFVSAIRSALQRDSFGQGIINALRTKSSRHPKVALSECEFKDGLLYYGGLLFVPGVEELQVDIIRQRHDNPAAGHPGRAATYELISRDYWWPGMRNTIARYLRNCDTCARIKPARHAPYGLLKPLQIPQRRWESVSMDFVTGLPLSSGSNAILVVVDRLSKMAHFIPTTDSVNSKGTAALFRDFVFRLHGLPLSLVSDRGTTFTSEFTRSLCKMVGIQQNISTAFHPQTDGQTERVNAVLEQYLRGYCGYQQDNWAELLTMSEFAYNNTISSTTLLSVRTSRLLRPVVLGISRTGWDLTLVDCWTDIRTDHFEPCHQVLNQLSLHPPQASKITPNKPDLTPLLVLFHLISPLHLPASKVASITQT